MTRLSITLACALACSSPETVTPTAVASGGEDTTDSAASQPASLALPLRRDVASTVSAPGVVRFTTTIAIALLGLLTADEAQSSCPRRTGTETRGTLEGGCTTDDGHRIQGRAIYDGDSEIATYRFEGFQLDQLRLDGTVRVRSNRSHRDADPTSANQPANEDWWVQLDTYAPLNNDMHAAMARADSGQPPQEDVYQTIQIDYEATQRDNTYEGRGTFTIGGFGTVRAETRAEVIDNDVCNSEAASGETILSTDTERIRIVYDGATDCDPTSTVIVEQGDERQELAGVQCSANGRVPHAWPLLVVLLLRRRRRR